MNMIGIKVRGGNGRKRNERRNYRKYLETRETDGIPIESFFVGRRRSLTHLQNDFELTKPF